MSTQRVWFCIDKRMPKPSRPAMYSIIYDILPGYSMGQKAPVGVEYIPLASEVARAKSLRLLIEQYEAGLDLQIHYRVKLTYWAGKHKEAKELIKGMTDEEALEAAEKLSKELSQISFDYPK